MKRSGVLRVGLDPTYPPFEFFDGSTLQGLDVDLAEAVAAQYGLEVQFSHFGFDGLYDALATEQVDILISALAPDLARTEDFAFSNGYFDAGLVLVSPATVPIQDATDLSGKLVAVELGAAGHVEATTLQRRVQQMAVKTYANADEALLGLTTGESDAAIVDNVAFRLVELPDPATELFATSLKSEPYAIVVREGDGELLVQINDALAELRESSRLELILERWLSN